MSAPFHVPTHMFPLIMKQAPPNIFFSENPFRRESIGRIRSTSTSSFVISAFLYLSQDFLEFGDEFPHLFERDQVEKNRQDFLPVAGGNHVIALEFLCGVTQDGNGFFALLGQVFPRPVLAFHHGIKLFDGHVNQSEPAAPFFTDVLMNGLMHLAADGFRDTHANGTGHPIQGQGQQFFGDGLRLLGGQGQSVFFEEIGRHGRRDELNEVLRRLLGLFGHSVLGAAPSPFPLPLGEGGTEGRVRVLAARLASIRSKALLRQASRLTLKPSECQACRSGFSHTSLIRKSREAMSYLLMAIAGLWMADGLALLVAPLRIVGQVRQALSTSPSLTKWSGVSLAAGLILLFQASDLIYPGLWVVTGVAMVAKGGFFLLSDDETRHAVLQWCLSREAVDYRLWGLGLCLLSVLLIHACGWL